MAKSKYKQGQVVVFTEQSGNAPGPAKTIESVEVHNNTYFYRLVGMTGMWVASSLTPWTGSNETEQTAVDL